MRKWIAMFLCAVLFISSSITFTSKAEAATMSDVSTKHWAHKSANWAVDNGILLLQAGKKFNPNATITEQDLVRMFAKLDRNYPYKITNGDLSMLYNHYGSLNIPLNGTTSKAKRAKGITRGEFAIIFAAMNGMDLSEIPAVRYLYIKEITTGSNNRKTYESYNPSKNLTRSEAAAFLYRMGKTYGMLSVEGFNSKAAGKDNSKITIPSGFAANYKPDTPSNTGGSNEQSANTPTVMKEVQSIKVANNALIANGVDSTLVSIKLKDSFGTAISNLESLQFQVSSKLNRSDLIQVDEDDYFGKVRVSNTPLGAATGAVWSDGGELNFYVTAPKLTKSYKDTIYVELVNSNDKKYAGYKNKRIEIPIQYTPKPELRVSYQVYDASIAEYVGDNNSSQDKIQFYPDSIPQGPIVIKDFDKDEKMLTIEGYDRDIPYEGATVSLGGSNYRISEYLFEQILDDLFEEYNSVTVNLFKGMNSEMAVDIPFSYIPDPHLKIAMDAPETLAIVSYLLSLLPSSFNDFSIAYYDSVIAVQAIYNTIPSAVINSGNDAKLTQIKNSMTALVELAQSVVQAEIDAQKEKLTSHTKIAISLVAPGGQLITNYRGNVEIEYNGIKRVVPFASNTSNSLTGTGHAGAAVYVFDGINYGDSEVKVTLLNDGKDTRYSKLLEALYDTPQKATIFADRPIDDRDFYSESEVALVADLSNSMNKVDPYNLVGTKLTEMIKRLDANPTLALTFHKDPTFLTSGSAESVLDFGPTLYSAAYRQGGTNLLEAVRIAIRNYSSIGDRSIQRNMIIVTDGQTQTGQFSQIISLANRNDIMLHIVTVGAKSEVNAAQMQRIATETNGSYYHANSYKTLSQAMQGVYDAVVLRYKSDGNICTAETVLEQSSLSISSGYILLQSSVNPNCSTTSVSDVKVKFFGDTLDLQLALKPIGHNEFELIYNINQIQMFDVYEEIEFAAYNSSGELVGTKRVKVQ